MKTVTYRNKEWYYATTKYHGIIGKTQYFVDINTEPTLREWEGNNYYVYSIIHRFNTFFIFSIFMLFIFGVAFIFACLAKMLFYLLAGKVKLIFDKSIYTQGINGEESPLLDAMSDVKEALNNKTWSSSWCQVWSERKLTYEELRKVIKANKDFDHRIVVAKNISA